MRHTVPRPSATTCSRPWTQRPAGHGGLTHHPDRFTDDNRHQPDALLERSPPLVTTHRLVHEFVNIMAERRGRDPTAWISAVDTDEEPALRTFAIGLPRDIGAVTAGLPLSHNSGPVECHINRIKMLERRKYERATLDPLLERVLHTR
ncbi:transposase [Rhodococcus sp. B50]|uniref:transposase n=1 Tax=Rhodococcus sp. B50 TaxID=2682847 RepID=UPI001BD5A7EC|nr:transposase [Rhodococcus sp. B50]MBS9372252.1 hypothetical protein [Rhodococcus sp. B50]